MRVAKDDEIRKDMSVLRETPSIDDTLEATKGHLKDYSLNHEVEIAWDLNDEAEKDRVFRLRIDDYEVYLDIEEFLSYSRWV